MPVARQDAFAGEAQRDDLPAAGSVGLEFATAGRSGRTSLRRAATPGSRNGRRGSTVTACAACRRAGRAICGRARSTRSQCLQRRADIRLGANVSMSSKTSSIVALIAAPCTATAQAQRSASMLPNDFVDRDSSKACDERPRLPLGGKYRVALSRIRVRSEIATSAESTQSRQVRGRPSKRCIAANGNQNSAANRAIASVTACQCLRATAPLRSARALSRARRGDRSSAG